MTDETVLNISILKEHIQQANEDIEVFRASIKALDQEPCDDAISRQAVLDIVNNPLNIRLDEIIKKTPSVTPQPKTGHWILTDDDLVYCSECEDSYYPRPIDASWYYCPHCGARME